MKINLMAIFVLSCIITSCEEPIPEDEVAQIGTKSCSTIGSYAINTGLDITRCAYTTNSTTEKGLYLIEIPTNIKDTNTKKYQHPSWRNFGWLGSITTDNFGNCYTAPIPVINTFDNTTSTINKICKVDSKTGEMKILLQLPKADSVEGVVPFGVLGIYFDCHAKILYAASVAGSTRDEERGVIYAIEPNSGTILDCYKNIDAMGLLVGGSTGKKILYLGSARNSNVYGIELKANGKFKGKHHLQFSLDQLGARGDDKARRIRYDEHGNLKVFGTEFNFSLAAMGEIDEQIYFFEYNGEENKWMNKKHD
jgi:hypothetical protein